MARLLLLLLPIFSALVLLAAEQQQPAPPSKKVPAMRILALFSTTDKELGLDHRLGRQVLKLAAQKATQMHAHLLAATNGLEILVESNEAECTSSNEMPNKVAERYYSQENSMEIQCKADVKNCPLEEVDLGQQDLFFSASPPPVHQKRSRRWTTVVGMNESAGPIDAILGPSCNYLVDLIARMAAYWRLPIYSVASIGGQFASKDIYPTLTRLSPSIDQLGLFVVKTMQKFQWTHLAILIDGSQIEMTLMLENLDRIIARQAHLHPIKRKVFPLNSRAIKPSVGNQTSSSGRCSQEARDVLMSSRRVARVLLLLVNGPQTIRQLLLCAYELGFRTAGFTFLALDLGLKSADAQQQQQSSRSSGASKSGQQSFDWYLADDEENNPVAKQMFESLMIFSVELPIGDEYSLFVEQTLDLAHEQYPQVRFDRSAVNSLAVALHDSFLLAVEAHLRQHRSPEPAGRSQTTRLLFANRSSIDDADWTESSDAKQVALMWNEHIAAASRVGFISSSLHINANGDQELDYVLSDLEPELGLMRAVASFSKETRQLELLPDTYVHWPKRVNTFTRELLDTDQVPPDEPECGFDDQADHCVDRQNLYAALTILVSLVGILALGSMFSLYKYRSIQYQMQLDDYWWKINWQDLQFVQMTESLASNAQSVARALKSGGSVVSAGSDGATSFVSVMRPARATGAGPSKSQTGAINSESVVSKVIGRQQRRQAVPLIVTSSETTPAHQVLASSSIHDDAKSSTTKISGSLLAAGSVLIRSEYSSVVRASNLAMYKDELVIVKQLNADHIEMSRGILIELKSIRELVNDNLARFVGLCLDPQRLAIVYEFCSRGSLQDLILNKDVAMDLTLKYSIIGDIVNGLSFIHTTLLDYHGRLKSTNLVLDGRFTVKITDFGLQNLYSQLELIQNQTQDEEEGEEKDDDDDDNEDDDDDARTTLTVSRQHADQVSLSVSAYNMESVSVVGARNKAGGSRAGGGGSLRGYSRVKLRNRGSARFFWTAPEHLREKRTHVAGSKRGDIYSLSIILLELLTRREPYYYGTNAQPHWPNINRDRRLFMQQQQQQQQQQVPEQQSSAGSRLVSRKGRAQLGSDLGAGRRMSQVGRRLKRNSVSPAAIEPAPDAISVISVSALSQASLNQHDSIEQQHGPGATAIDEEAKRSRNQQELEEEEEADDVGQLNNPRAMEPAAGGLNQKQKAGKKPLDAEEILDQLRMGIKPEPVRPYIPNYVSHSISAKMIELTCACWNEAPQHRPPLNQVRTQLRKISRGLASRNYLDNLLDRLQTYAADLERIVDSKTADIMGEKQRTEELLYQLVPKFVADRLKRSEPIVPQVFDGVTIFFSDIVGFEKYASVMSPTELVDLLNSVYSSFDSIISSFDVTKIETIIDQFLVAAGITFQQHESAASPAAAAAAALEAATDSKEKPADEQSGKRGAKRGKLKRIGLMGSLGKDKSQSSSQDQGNSNGRNDNVEQQQQQQQPQQPHMASDSSHYRRSSAEQIGRMALCIRDLVKSFHFRQNISQQQQQQQGSLMGSTFNIRIGIHSGRVCAGIVGVKRPKFCLIGDTVNVASRMHTNSKANKIQISDDTRQLLEQVPGFSIEPRGKIEVKGKGLMETFWLESSY